MRSRAFFAPVIASLVCVAGASAQLQNPSFELPGSTSIFENWTTFENAVPEFAIFRTGAVSLKVYGNGGNAYNAAGAFQDVPVSAGQAYEASAWGYNSSADPMGGSNFAVINIEWINSSGGQISFVSGPVIAAGGPLDTWTRGTVAGVAPTETVAARVVALHIQGPELASGAAFFDDVSFAPTTISGPINPSFEQDFTGWNGFNNVFIDTTLVHTGTKAAKMFGCFCAPFNATGVFQDFPAQPGQNWEGKAWVATRGDDRISGGNFAVLNIEWRDAANNLISYISTLAADATTTPDQWRQVTVSGVAPAGTTIARIVPLHIQPAFAGGAVWWDDIEMGIAQTQPCLADWNQDGGIDGDDVIAFFGDWDQGNADYNDDDGTDGDDVIAFFGDWDNQCAG